MDYIISCCSTLDVSLEHLKESGLEYIGFHYVVNGEQHIDDLGQKIPFSKFYEEIKKGANTSTSQISIGEYEDYFKKLMSSGKDLIHISLSTGISSTYQSACAAAENIRTQFPDQKLYVVDSLCASSGYGLFMDLLSEKRSRGMSIDDLFIWANEHKKSVSHWFCSTDLSYFVKGGRISKTSGVIGGIFEICPVMDVTPEGKLEVIKKIRTKKKGLTELVNKMEEHAIGGLDYSGPCYISHSECIEDAKFVKDLILKRFKKVEDVKIFYIGTTIGSHTGLGTTALFFIGDKRENAK